MLMKSYCDACISSCAITEDFETRPSPENTGMSKTRITPSRSAPTELSASVGAVKMIAPFVTLAAGSNDAPGRCAITIVPMTAVMSSLAVTGFRPVVLT